MSLFFILCVLHGGACFGCHCKGTEIISIYRPGRDFRGFQLWQRHCHNFLDNFLDTFCVL